MKITRRAFLHQTLALGPVAMTFLVESDPANAQGGPECSLPTGLATRFVPNEPKVVLRISAADMATRGPQLQQFREAIGMVRDLPANDVRTWTKQIAQHCLHCGTSNPADEIHFNWNFLPWHRAFLYFLERTLRTLSKNDDLRLVYWDWESPQSRTLPQIYGPAGQPLYWKNRNLGSPAWPLDDDRVDVQRFLAVPDWRDFGGTAGVVPATFSGPHANVHNAFRPGDMANLRYSPRDPVFYAHHTNMDRLWSSWIHAGHANPDFGDAKVYFYDETRQWRYVLLNDLRDEKRLGYTYQMLMQPALSLKQVQLFVLNRAGTAFSLPREWGVRAAAKQAGPNYLIMENIQNLDKLPVNTLEYAIVSGERPAPGAVAASVKGYLGTVVRVAIGEKTNPGPLSAALNVTGKLGTLKGGSGAFELAVAPLDDARRVVSPVIPLVAARVAVIG